MPISADGLTTRKMELLLDRMEKYNKINDIIIQICPKALHNNDFDLALKIEIRHKENISNQLSCYEEILELDKETMKEADILLTYNKLKRDNDKCDEAINLCKRAIVLRDMGVSVP